MHSRFGSVGVTVLALAACRPSDVLRVPAPAGVVSSSALQNQGGADGALDAAKVQLFAAADGNFSYGGLLAWNGLLTDEFTFSGFSVWGAYANPDARETVGRVGFQEAGDYAWQNLLRARSSLVLVLHILPHAEPTSGIAKVGEAYALVGYAELLLAESYCAGTPLDALVPGGGIEYGTPLTTDSLFGEAEAHFDSALAQAHGDATIAALASAGMGRVLLDRGQFAAAAAAVHAVPTSFVYNAETPPTYSQAVPQANIYAMGAQFGFERFFDVADGEGANGLPFISAHDPRLLLDTTSYQTTDGTAPWRLPMKFEANLAVVPLATGIEARLIEAEVALQTGNAGVWLADLNALRNGGCTVSGADTTCSLGSGQVPSQTSGLPSLADPGTDSGRVTLMFRERAFWLFGTGARLGDLRRLIRQYGRDAESVFPTGPYANGHNSSLPTPLPNYGTDVSLTIPTPYGLAQSALTISNPNYRGCILSTRAA